MTSALLFHVQQVYVYGASNSNSSAIRRGLFRHGMHNVR